MTLFLIALLSSEKKKEEEKKKKNQIFLFCLWQRRSKLAKLGQSGKEDRLVVTA